MPGSGRTRPERIQLHKSDPIEMKLGDLGNAAGQILDVFSGRGGSHDQGAPTTEGAGDGAKKRAIDDWISSATGMYEVVTGAGRRGGPAPGPALQTAPPQRKFKASWGVAAVAVLVVIVVFVLRRK